MFEIEAHKVLKTTGARHIRRVFKAEVTSYRILHATHKDLDLTLCRDIECFKQERDVTRFAFWKNITLAELEQLVAVGVERNDGCRRELGGDIHRA